MSRFVCAYWLCCFFCLVIVLVEGAYLNALLHLQEVPGKGLGFYAAERIQVGELLIREAPLLSLTPSSSWFKPTESYQYKRLEQQLNKLSKEEKDLYFNLFCQNTRETSNEAMKALDIFRSNAYPTRNEFTARKNDDSSGVFASISRINSSCNPNVHYSWSASKKVGNIHCIRPIQKGEEIVNNYVGVQLPFVERQEYLSRHFGFDCTCEVCISQDRAKCDVRRIEYSNWSDQKVDGHLKSNGIDNCNMRLEIINQDDFLQHSSPLKYEVARDMLECIRLQQREIGDNSNSDSSDSSDTVHTQIQKWMDFALTNCKICKGEDSEHVEMLLQIQKELLKKCY